MCPGKKQTPEENRTKDSTFGQWLKNWAWELDKEYRC